MKIEAYCTDKRMIEHQPLEIKNKPPSWWHNLKKTFTRLDMRSGINVPTPTIRACPGVVDFIRKPIVVHLWTDVIFKVFPDGRVSVATPSHNGGNIKVGVHDESQYGELYPNHTVCKITNPWVLKGSDRTDFLVTDVHYNTEFRKHGMFIAPGVTNFYDQHSLNIFICFETKEEPYEITLKYDQPLMAVFPMTNDKVDIKMFKTTEEGRNEIVNNFPSTFLGRYYSRKHARRK